MLVAVHSSSISDSSHSGSAIVHKPMQMVNDHACS